MEDGILQQLLQPEKNLERIVEEGLPGIVTEKETLWNMKKHVLQVVLLFLV